MDKKSVAAFLGEVETYLSVLAPGLLLRPLLEWAAAFRAQAIETSDVIAYEVADGNLFDWNLQGGVGGAWNRTPQGMQRQCRNQAPSSFEG